MDQHLQQRRRTTVVVASVVGVVVLVTLLVVLLGRSDRDETAPVPGPPPSPSAGAPGTAGLSLTQFNVRNRDAAVRTALVGRPLLLGLNEADRVSRAYRDAQPPDGYTLTAAPTGTRGERQNALLTAPGVRVVSSRTVPLSPAVPDLRYADDRWALVVELDVPGVGRHLHVQTHLLPLVRRVGDGTPRAELYATSVDNLGDLLADLDDAPSLTVSGDFNLSAGSEREFAWAPVLRRHGLDFVSDGVDVLAFRGLDEPSVDTIPRGVSDHPGLEARFGTTF